MAVSVAGLGHPLLRLCALLSSKADLRSILCISSFCVVLLVLAYLTNPSESSFRAYLTELSFRQHLSSLDRLDDLVDNDPFRDASPSATRSNQSSYALSLGSPALLHFATRASVSLRTPKHVFHSFGVFTVATILPMAKSSQRHDTHISSFVTDSWYVGAFGKWWRGGIIEAWYQDVVARSKDEESWSSGILSLNNLDMRRDYSGLPLSSCGVSVSPPKLRNRERPSQRTSTPPRCNTPPPLPKTASLPLHASRSQINYTDRPPISHVSQQSTQAKSSSSIEQINSATGLQALSDLSAPAADLLRQISVVKTTVMDLRTQLSECQSTTSQSRTQLQDKVDAYRERRRREDAVKVELRSRTKSLDDSKRQAEGSKREAEKKLKVAQNVHGDTSRCLTLLDERIIRLQEQMATDRNVVIQRSIQQSPSLHELVDVLELKKDDVKSTEERIALSSQRVRDLEYTLNHERERLKALKHRLTARKELVRRPIGNWTVHSDQGFSISSPDVADFTRLLPEGGQPVAWESCLNEHEMQLGEPLSALVDSNSSSSPSHYHQEVMPMDTLSRSVSCLADRLPCLLLLGDASDPREVTTSSYPPVHPKPIISSDHTSRNATSLGRPFVFRREDAIPSDSLELDDLDIGPELLPVDERPPVRVLPHLSRASWDPQSDRNSTMMVVESGGIMRSDWPSFDFNENSRKGLNPSAKEFSLGSRPISSRLETSSLYDALDPNGFRINAGSSAAISNPSLLRAFAPSPAERQVFQRALGTASNASLELLPSLGDVGTIPISPSLTIGTSKVSSLGRALPSWLLTPHNHKVNFSPWDDEEQEQHRNVS